MSPDQEDYLFGFKWGPAHIHRICHIEGKGRLLSVKTEHGCIEVWISEKGKSLRAFRDGRELS